MASKGGGTSSIAERYATALFDLADEAKALDAVSDDLKGFRAALADSDDLRRLIRSPVLSRDAQVRALAAIADKSGMGNLAKNFLCLVARNRRLFALPAMIEAFLRILATRRGEVTARVSSAAPLSDAQTTRLTDQLRGIVGGKVALEQQVDPALLGGMVVRLGSRMYDSSIRSKLQRLQIAMKGAQ